MRLEAHRRNTVLHQAEDRTTSMIRWPASTTTQLDAASAGARWCFYSTAGGG